jgi:hypothetical protein
MSIFKRGSVYWYHFLFNGQHIQNSTKQGNHRTARQIEAAYRTALAKGEVGITERKRIPAFKAAMTDFLEWSEEEHKAHPGTHRRYQVSAVAYVNTSQTHRSTASPRKRWSGTRLCAPPR